MPRYRLWISDSYTSLPFTSLPTSATIDLTRTPVLSVPLCSLSERFLKRTWYALGNPGEVASGLGNCLFNAAGCRRSKENRVLSSHPRSRARAHQVGHSSRRPSLCPPRNDLGFRDVLALFEELPSAILPLYPLRVEHGPSKPFTLGLFGHWMHIRYQTRPASCRALRGWGV